MIVTKKDKIKNLKFVKVLGFVKVRSWGHPESVIKQKLIKLAEEMGADAITNYSYGSHGKLGVFTSAIGTAVKLKLPESIIRALDKSVCWECGNKIEENQKFCGKCGTNLIYKDYAK